MATRPYHLYPSSPRPTPRWRVEGRATQPGLAAWWRLLAPDLGWANAHSRRVAFACLRGASLDPTDPTRRTVVTPAIVALPHRERLITVTRGPMACKKQSRVQLLVRRQVVGLVTSGASQPMPLRSASAFGALRMALRAKAQLWAQPLGAPLALVGARLSWPVTATALLLWA